jgi:hypothetical protein
VRAGVEGSPEITGARGAAGDARGEEGRGGKVLPGAVGWSERRRGNRRNRSAEGQGRVSWAELAVREGEEKKRVGRRERGPGERGRKREGGNGPARGKGPAQGGEGRQVGLPSLISFPFSFSNPFETQIYLNSNELLNSNPMHSFQ